MGEFFRGWRRNAVRIVICAVLVLAVYGAMLVWLPDRREQRIAREIEAFGGEVHWRYAGPDWIPQSIQDRTRLFHRGTGLHFYNSHITDTGLEHLKGLTNLRVLNLTNTKITDAGLEHLNGMNNLTMLDLQSTQVTDTGLEHLTGLTNLTGLCLRRTQVTDAGLEHLKGLTNLTYLNLNTTQVTDAGLEHLKGLTNLTQLDVKNTQVTLEASKTLRNVLQKCDIYPYLIL